MISVDLDNNDKSMGGSNNTSLNNYQITEEKPDSSFKDDGYYWYSN